MKVIIFLCFSLAWAILPIPTAEAQNCPNDWHPPPCGPANPISPEMKDHAKLWSYGFNSARLYLTPLIYLYGAGCVGAGDSDACALAVVLVAARRGTELGKHWADKFVNDPWDDQFGEPYEPRFYDPVSQLGSPDCAQDGRWLLDVCAWFNAQAQHIYAYWEAAYVSANRAASCAMVGNEDCFWWQKGRMYDFVRAAGTHTGYLGDGLSLITNITGSQDASNAAAEVHYVGQLMEVEQCGDC